MDDDDGILIEVDVETELVIRSVAIARLAGEFGQLTRVPPSVIKTITEGFSDKLLAKVTFLMLSSGEELLAHLTLKVDWERFSGVLSKGTDPTCFTIDPTQSIAAQIALPLQTALDYIASQIGRLPIVRTEPVYTSRHGKTEEFRKRFNTVPISEATQIMLNIANTSDDYERLVLSDGRLREFEVSYGHLST